MRGVPARAAATSRSSAPQSSKKPSRRKAQIRSFLIADIRGYTTFTRENGDEAAARLASRFATLAREAVEARSGSVIELRGDEALAVFTSARQAIRAAVEMQATFAEEMDRNPSLPLKVGIGVNAGEAVPVEDGFRGSALNLAARLCSRAVAGEVLASDSILQVAGVLDGVSYEADGRRLKVKGFDKPVLIRRVELDAAPPALGPSGSLSDAVHPLPPELDGASRIVGREGELRWLRGTWRQARRGRGRIVFLTGPAGIGKTTLAGEIARSAHDDGAVVSYAGRGIRKRYQEVAAAASTAPGPTVVVMDDADDAGPVFVKSLAKVAEHISSRPVLVLVLVRDPSASHALEAFIDEFDPHGDSHRALAGLDRQAITDLVGFYAPGWAEDLPLDDLVRSTQGVPLLVHEVAAEWAQEEATERMSSAATRAMTGRSELRAIESELTTSVMDLQVAQERAQLHVVTEEERTSRRPTAVVCPFKGLASFDVSDAEYYFGRERLIGELVARLVSAPFLGVIGPSGSGKSSLVRAGIVPALRAGVIPGSDRWRSVIFRPGEHPERALNAALRSARLIRGSDEGGVESALESLGRDEPLVLIADQFEEVFTMCQSEDERRAFLHEMTQRAVELADDVVQIIIMRADLYGRCAEYPELANLVSENQVLVGAMRKDELRRAIEMPCERAGLIIEPELVEALLEDVADEPGGLPLLSTALLELWQRRRGRSLTLEQYRVTGGVHSAVARLAEEAYQRLDDRQRARARGVLLRLAAPGVGGASVRRRLPLAELDLDTNADAKRVLEVLTDSRLVTTSEGVAEVAHEALLSEWPRLRTWLEEDSRGRELHRYLTKASADWEKAGRDPELLYAGTRLANASEWAASHEDDLNDLEATFLRTSQERAEAASRRRTRRLRAFVAALLGAVAVFGLLAVMAASQKRRADQESQTALSRELAANAIDQLSTDPELGLLLALEAVRRSETDQAAAALRKALLTARPAATLGAEGDLNMQTAISSDGELAVTMSKTGLLQIWDVERSSVVRTMEHPRAIWVVFSPDGELLASVGGGVVKLWSVADGRLIADLPHKGEPTIDRPEWSTDGETLFTPDNAGVGRLWDRSGKLLHELRGHSGPLWWGSFTPDGERLVVASADMTASVWDVSSGERLTTLRGHTDDVIAPMWSRDGDFIFTGSRDGTLRWWKTDGTPLRVRHHSEEPNNDVVIDVSPDGETILSSGGEKEAKVWSVATGELLLTLEGHTSDIIEARFSPGGDEIVTSTVDGNAWIWDAASGQPTVKMVGAYWPAVFSEDGRYVASAGGSVDEAGRLWSIDSGPERSLRGLPGAVAELRFSADRQRLFVGGTGGEVWIWDTSKGEPISKLTRFENDVVNGDISPDGSLAVVSDEIFIPDLPPTRVWDTNTGERVYTIRFPRKDPGDLCFTGYPCAGLGTDFAPDGSLAVTAYESGYIYVWDTAGGEITRTFGPYEKGVTFVMFGPDGKTVLAGFNDGAVRLIDPVSGETIHELNASGGTSLWGDYYADGSRVVAIDQGGFVRAWEVETGSLIHEITTNTLTLDGTVSDDGRFLVTAGSGVATVIDLETGQEVSQFGLPTSDVEFGPDNTIYMGSSDGTVRIFTCDICLPLPDLIQMAENEATRELTEAERKRFLHESG